MIYERSTRIITLTVPITIQSEHTASYIAPKELSITVSGAAHTIARFMQTSPQIHLMIDTLPRGMQSITLTPQHLLLPHDIQLLHYSTIHIMKLF